jgi:dihydropteroate synthase type 2
MRLTPPKVVGIVNITTDSFFDGGLYIDPDAAIGRARYVSAKGASIVELGAASSHPDSQPVSAREEQARLAPVIHVLKGEGYTLSVDTCDPETQRFALDLGIEYLNDISGFPDASMYPMLAASEAKLVVMHSVLGGRQAARVAYDATEVWGHIEAFFDQRIEALTAAGLSEDRLILDPGLGFFLADSPEPSVAVLGSIGRLIDRYHHPVLISASRKSFLQRLVGRSGQEAGAGRRPEQRRWLRRSMRLWRACHSFGPTMLKR